MRKLKVEQSNLDYLNIVQLQHGLKGGLSEALHLVIKEHKNKACTIINNSLR
jgi:hypothetical protein